MKPSPSPDIPPTTARALALQTLLLADRGRAFASEVLDRNLQAHPLSPPDRRFATQLVYGTLRRRGTLDALLRPLINRPPHRVEPWLWEALRLGAYQLTLLTHVPPHAAINETVELATAAGRPGAKGFLNGVLRQLSRLVTDQPADAPAANALPVENGVYRRLAGPTFADPAADPAEYLAAGFSWPRWLADRWLARHGWDECVRLGFWFAGPAPLWLRVNRLKGTRVEYQDLLAAKAIPFEPGAQPQAVRITEPIAVRDLPGYEEGWFAVQDESAQRIAAALSPAPGSTVLDLCAAPGGKTTHLAELMGNRGRIVACDVDDDRLKTLTTLAARLGVTIIEPVRLSDDPPAGPFDAALVDVPCSNTGVLGRRPEVRWRLSPRDFEPLIRLQTKLLLQACERVRPGGAVGYSTCSVEPDENGGVVRAVLRGMKRFKLEAEEGQVPGRPADGGYWARLRCSG